MRTLVHPATQIPTKNVNGLSKLFPAERARVIRLLVERVEIGPAGADIRLRTDGLANLVRDLGVRQAA